MSVQKCHFTCVVTKIQESVMSSFLNVTKLCSLSFLLRLYRVGIKITAKLLTGKYRKGSDSGLPYPTLPYPTLSYPILPYPTLSYPTLSYPTLPSPGIAEENYTVFHQQSRCSSKIRKRDIPYTSIEYLSLGKGFG